MEKIGDLSETKGEITIEWRIKDFSSLHHEIGKHYESPKFIFVVHLGLSGFIQMAIQKNLKIG